MALCVAIAGTMDMVGNMWWFDAFVGPWIADVMPQTLSAPKRGTLVIAALSSYLLLRWAGCCSESPASGLAFIREF